MLIHHRLRRPLVSGAPPPALARPYRRTRRRPAPFPGLPHTTTRGPIARRVTQSYASSAINQGEDEPDPRVVRCLEAHALEANSGVFLPSAAASPPSSSSRSSSSSSSLSPDAADAAAAARLQAEIEAREAALVHSLLASTNRLPPRAPAPSAATAAVAATTSVLDVARGAAALSRAAGLKSAFRALQALKRSPELLSLPERELARRALALKLALPAADVGALVSMRPSLLLVGSPRVVARVVRAAEAQITALMPGIPWQRKLAEGGTVYWSFASVLDGSGQAAARARAEEEEEQQQQEDEEEADEEEAPRVTE